MIERLQIILQILLDNDLYVKPEKCIFFTKKVDFLGFIIEDRKIRMDPTKLSGILKWPAPKTLKQVRSFIGFCNFYHHFVDQYSDKCAPLNLPLRKTQPWIWNEKQQTTLSHTKFVLSRIFELSSYFQTLYPYPP